MTKLGLHVTTGSRNGYNLTAPHARGIVSFLADAFVEAAPTTYRVLRLRYEYESQRNDDIMPGFDSLTVAQMAAQAAYWWPRFKTQVEAEEQRLGVRIDALKLTNEVGGNDPVALEKLIAYELALMALMEQDGRTLVFGNFASASPHWEIWEQLCAPFVQEGWQRGHIYSRHAYFDIGDYYTHMERPFFEMEHFDEPGPTILGEVGFVSFPGSSTLISMLDEYDTQLALYPEIGFGAIFTYGQWNNANIQNASAALGDYLRERPFEPWYPHYDPPTPPPPGGQHRAIVVKCPQDIGRADFQNVAAVAYDFRHTLTLSHDDMLTILRGGNRESYVKASHPARDREALDLVEAAGYRWEPLFPNAPPPPPTAVNLVYRPCDTDRITQPFGANPAVYDDFGLPGHEGIDYGVALGLPFYAAAAGRVAHASDRMWSSSGASNYGWHVVLDHGDYTTVYAHATANLPVSVGQQVAAGQIVGYSGNTGNSTGPHLHFGLLDKTGTIDPDNGYPTWRYGRPVNPAPYLVGKPAPPVAPPPPPPPGQLVDLRPYFQPSGQVGPFYVVADLNGRWTMDMQLQREADGSVVMIKGHQYERWNAAGDYLLRYEDTSPGEINGRRWAYTQHGGRWIPISWRVGSLYAQEKRVTRHWLDNCQEWQNDVVTDYIRFKALHATWQSPANQAITLQNVVELWWVRGPNDGSFIERYLLAPGMGYVSWANESGNGMAIVDMPQGRPPLRRERVCWG